ncbi:hypothetical protein [Novosphingobium sp. MBES04]|uniref:hypothetical protein n=1 Tax=Novosphingobium sp. MBES04 TaxID=1206458 RepID=UPI000580A36B|nr:hypothetical protein [Novosphingobium sp. MBES04]
MENDKYQPRVVAFLDILGFSKLVENADDPEWRRAILGLVDTMRNTVGANPIHGDLRATQFSDCIVISGQADGIGLHGVLQGAVFLANNLLQQSVLLRGGIACGNMIHTDEVLFGPGYLRAYEMDRSGAPPRISIHSSLEPLISGPMWEEVFAFRTDPYDLTKTLNTLREYQIYTPEPKVGQVILDENARYLAERIAGQCYKAEHIASVRAKWLWMERYWNEAVGWKGMLPTTEAFRP